MRAIAFGDVADTGIVKSLELFNSILTFLLYYLQKKGKKEGEQKNNKETPPPPPVSFMLQEIV